MRPAKWGLEPLKNAVTLADLRMEWKLIVIFLVLIVIPIPVLGYVSYRNYADSIQKNTTVYVTEVSNEMVKRLDDYIEDMKRISTIPAYVDEIKDNLEMSNDFYDRLSRGLAPSAEDDPGMNALLLTIRQKVEGSINFLNNIKEDTKSVYLFDKYGNPYYRYKNGFRPDIKDRYSAWKRAVDDRKGLPALLGTEQVINNANGRNYVFSVIREVFNNAYEPIGIIVVDANISFIERIVQDLDKATNGNTFIIDQNNDVIYDSNKTYMTQNMSNAPWLAPMQDAQGSFVADIDGEKSLVIYTLSHQTQWKVIITVPVSELTKDVASNRNLTIAATLLVIGLALLISVVAAFAITRSLRSLVNLMKKVQQGNLDVKYPVASKDEIGLLGTQFNRMLERIKLLIEENLRIGERKKEAELDALQTQINPHFIYNTLESIRMTAEINDDEEVADMTHILGKLLRYSISMGKEFVTLEQELQHVTNYMLLQNYRYPNKFVLRIEPYESFRSLKLLKLMLQPIVENAIFHGMDDSQETMELSVKFQRSEGRVEIQVADNGTGMEEQTLEKLRSSLRAVEGPISNKRGIGLRNVNERLKLYYGEGFGLEVDSAPGAGTVIRMTIPARF